MNSLTCYRCGKAQALGPGAVVSRRDTCPHCGADSRVCRNCRHYDVSARSQCREDVAEPVTDKEKANFCDSFQPSGAATAGTNAPSTTDLKSAAEALFKKGG